MLRPMSVPPLSFKAGWLVRIEESEDGVIPFSIKKEIKIEYDDRGNVVKWFVISPWWCQCDFVEYEYY